MRGLLSTLVGIILFFLIIETIKYLLNCIGLELSLHSDHKNIFSFLTESILFLSLLPSWRIAVSLYYRKLNGKLSKEQDFLFKSLFVGTVYFTFLCCILEFSLGKYHSGYSSVLSLILETSALFGIIWYFKIHIFKKSLLLLLEHTKFQKQDLRLLTDNMRSWSGLWRQSIIDVISKIAITDREHFVQHALQLISPKMGDWERARMIEAISKIEALERDSIIGQALRLISPDMSGWDRERVINIISKITIPNREHFVQQASQLMPPDMSGWKRANVIKTISKTGIAE